MLLNQVSQGQQHLDYELRLLASSEQKIIFPALTGVTNFKLHPTTCILRGIQFLDCLVTMCVVDLKSPFI